MIVEFIETNWISICGALIGLLYIYLEYKANIAMWAVSILMAVFYIYIFYSTQLYASMTIYGYFFFASIYGWLMWVVKHRKDEEITFRTIRAPRKVVLPTIVAVIVVFLLIYLLLKYYTENTLFISLGDAMTTSLNIVALWMISRKWAEQWLLVIPANAISSVLLFVQQDVLSGCLFLAYFIISIAGYYHWKRLAMTE